MGSPTPKSGLLPPVEEPLSRSAELLRKEGSGGGLLPPKAPSPSPGGMGGMSRRRSSTYGGEELSNAAAEAEARHRAERKELEEEVREHTRRGSQSHQERGNIPGAGANPIRRGAYKQKYRANRLGVS
eukprot:4061743-Pyramimonas_sp.AAC.1